MSPRVFSYGYGSQKALVFSEVIDVLGMFSTQQGPYNGGPWKRSLYLYIVCLLLFTLYVLKTVKLKKTYKNRYCYTEHNKKIRRKLCITNFQYTHLELP